MKQIIKENRLFLMLFTLAIAVAFIMIYMTNHGDSVLFFSKNRQFWANHFFPFITKAGEGPGYVFCIVLLLTIGFRYIDVLMFPIIAILVTIISSVAKFYFSYPRPLQYFKSLNIVDELNLIEGVHIYSANTSFPSGHTTSGFALFGLMAFFMAKKPSFVIIFFTIALLIGISRVYMTQHFLEDITAGAILGVFIALATRYIHSKVNVRSYHWLLKGIKNNTK